MRSLEQSSRNVSTAWDKLVSALNRYNYDLDVVQVCWLVQGKPKYQLVPNGSKGDIDVLLVPMEDWDWSRASHDTCPQTTDAWDGRKFFGDALKEQPQLTKKRSGHIMKSFNQLQRLTWKEAP